jgi:hypothetical protein
MMAMYLMPRRVIAGLLLSTALLFSITVRCRLLSFPLDRDEGEYAYVGQLILRGIPPYKLAYNMKLPGAYLVYAGVMAVFGQTPVGVHTGLLAINVVTILLAYLLTRQLFDDISAGAAAVLYSVLSLSISVFGMSAHATHFVAVFGLAATFVLWRSLQSSDWCLTVGSGVLFGLAFLMKQQGVFLIGFGTASVLARLACGRNRSRLRVGTDLLAFGIGTAVPYLLTCWWLWSAGVWPAFKFWTIDYAAQYVQYVPWREGLVRAFRGTVAAMGWNFLLWSLALLGLIGLIDTIVTVRTTASQSPHAVPQTVSASSNLAPSCWFVCGYLLFSALCVIPSFIFRPHYFVVLLPPLAILGGAGCGRLGFQHEQSWINRWFGRRNRSRQALADYVITDQQLRAVQPVGSANRRESVGANIGGYRALGLLMFAVVPTVLLQADYFFSTPPQQICRKLYGTNPFPEAQAIADYLREHSEPTDSIAVLGSEPELYFLSQRSSCTGYIYTYALMEPQPFAHRMHEDLIHQIEQGRPKYIVDVQIIWSWMEVNNGETLIFDWKKKYLPSHYTCVGVVAILPGRDSVFHWDQEVKSPIPKSDSFVVVYQRN